MHEDGQAFLFPIPEPDRARGPYGPRAEATKARTAKRIQARQARDKAVARGLMKADPVWVAEAERAVLKVSAGGKRFTADDVFIVLEGVGVKTHDTRALGGVMTGLRKRGEILPLMEFVATTRKSRHAAPIRVWQGKA